MVNGKEDVDRPKDISKFLHEPQVQIAPPDLEKLSKTNLVLLRHATTTFNEECFRIANEFGEGSPEWEAFKVDPAYADPPLSEMGNTQCFNARQHINKIDFKVVFVSPMLRTFQTTVECFKEHPNKKSIKFLVLTLQKEGLYLNNDLMGGNFKEKIYDIYSNPNHPATGGLHFDFSLMFGYGTETTMQFSVLADVERLQKPYSFISADAKNGNEANS